MPGKVRSSLEYLTPDKFAFQRWKISRSLPSIAIIHDREMILHVAQLIGLAMYSPLLFRKTITGSAQERP